MVPCRAAFNGLTGADSRRRAGENSSRLSGRKAGQTIRVFLKKTQFLPLQD